MSLPDPFDATTNEAGAPIAIPHQALSADALRGVVESFVLREGTDYGEREWLLGQKLAHVIAQLEAGQAKIFFDPISETVDIVTTERIHKT